MSRRRDRLFVYGTLRKGFPLHSLLRKLSVRYMGKGKIQGHLYSLGEFPGAVQSSSSNEEIVGEVYELLKGKRQLEELDRVEEFYPDRPEESLFVRQMTVVKMLDGKALKAWAYFLPKPPSKARLIHSGDYQEAHRPRN